MIREGAAVSFLVLLMTLGPVRASAQTCYMCFTDSGPAGWDHAWITPESEYCSDWEELQENPCYDRGVEDHSQHDWEDWVDGQCGERCTTEFETDQDLLLAAVERNDWVSVDRLIANFAWVEYNTARQAVQIMGCGDAVLVHIPVDSRVDRHTIVMKGKEEGR